MAEDNHASSRRAHLLLAADWNVHVWEKVKDIAQEWAAEQPHGMSAQQVGARNKKVVKALAEDRFARCVVEFDIPEPPL